VIRALAAALLCAACAPSGGPLRAAGPGAPREPQANRVRAADGRLLMGTVLEIELLGRDEAAGRAALERCFERVAGLERLFTRFDPESALSRLNRGAGRGLVEVDPALARILADARAYAELTRGTFDPTVGPLVALWGEAARRGKPPSAAELAAARTRVGWEGIEASVEPPRAGLARPGMAVDLGGFAKGWALDRVGEILAEEGVRDAFASFGGSSFLALGAPPGEPGWRVWLRDAAGGFAGELRLRDRSLAVSGSLGQTIEVAGRAYGHVIDPRRGEPLVRAAQAAVVAPGGALAEALGKALLVLGEEEGIALVEGIGEADAFWIDAAGRSRRTSGWDGGDGPSIPPPR
jgi:thiamine biosynthesis lipoprotein